jgi:hypothetical protein
MNSILFINTRLVVCLTMFTILSACASGRINLVEEGRLEIETEAPEEITISVKGVFEEEELVEIKGVVWWQPGSPDELYTAHIDIEILGSDGSATTEAGVPLRRIFLHRAIRQRARFSALVEPFVMEGATVRVIFHRDPHDDPAGGKDVLAPAGGEGTK